MKTFVVESLVNRLLLESSLIITPEEYSRIFNYGWGNGYVVLEKTHPWYGWNYNDIPVDVHGGLTYGKIINEATIENFPSELDDNDLGKFIIGFDTAHFYSKPEYWTEERVREETQNLLRQCYK